MNKREIFRFIQENKDTITNAPLQQKIRLLKLIRESLDGDKLPPDVPTVIPQNTDYLEER